MTQDVNPTLRPFVVSVKLDSSERNCPAGHRLAKVGWRETDAMKKRGEKPRSAMVCPVPVLTVQVVPDLLATAVNEHICDLQDAIFSEIVNAAIKDDTSILAEAIKIDPATFTMQGIANWCAIQSEKSKLSKDAIGNWFDTMLRSALEQRLSAIPGITDEMLLASLTEHKNNLTGLASTTAGKMPEKLVKQLLKAVGLVQSEDRIKSALTAKLQGYIKPIATEMAVALDID